MAGVLGWTSKIFSHWLAISSILYSFIYVLAVLSMHIKNIIYKDIIEEDVKYAKIENFTEIARCM